jgi:hypothetical protein
MREQVTSQALESALAGVLDDDEEEQRRYKAAPLVISTFGLDNGSAAGLFRPGQLFSMDAKYIALLGVALGWILSTASSILQRRSASKRSLGKAITSLLFWNFEMVQVYGVIEFLKDIKQETKEFEKSRQRALARYTAHDQKFHDSLGAAIDLVSEISPLDGYALSEAYRKYEFLKGMKLDWTSLDHATYVKKLSTLEAAFITYQRNLETLLLRLAWQHGFTTWLRLRRRVADFRIEVGKSRTKDTELEDYEALRRALETFQSEEKARTSEGDTKKQPPSDLSGPDKI